MSTILNAIPGDAHLFVVVVQSATNGVKLCIVHSKGRYDLTLPSSLLSTVQRWDTKEPVKRPLQVFIFTVWNGVGGEEWKWDLFD